MKKAMHRKHARKRKSHRRSKSWVAMWIMSCFKGGRVLAGKFASVMF
jgi:hypothetical protein